MSKYTLVITTTDAARKKAKQKGYNIIISKGVETGGTEEYTSAWIVLNVSDIGKKITIPWTVDYMGNFTAETIADGVHIEVEGEDIPLEPGLHYIVNENSTFTKDKNRGKEGTAFHFHNDAGYGGEEGKEYTPTISSTNNNGKHVPIWTASTGVTVNGRIDAHPVEKVRVWLGKYEAGEAVRATYSTRAVEFDLTEIHQGEATLKDNLDGWTELSKNAKEMETLGVLEEGWEPMPELIFGLKKPTEENPIRTLIRVILNRALPVELRTVILSYFLGFLPASRRPRSVTLKEGNIEIRLEYGGPQVRALLATLGSSPLEKQVDSKPKSFS